MKTKSSIIIVTLLLYGLNTYSQNVISVCTGDTVYFKSSLKYYSTYQWNFDDGNYSFEEKPRHVYSQIGEYDVTVTAFDNCCPNKDTTYECTVYVTAGSNCNSNANDSLYISPNPVFNLMYVSYYTNNVNSNTNLILRITQVNSGNIIQTINLNPMLNHKLINVSNLTSGFYSVALLVNNVMTVQKSIYKD